MISPLRIAIDGRSLHGELTGVGIYTSNLLEQLLSIDPSIGIFLLTNRNPVLPPSTRMDQIQVLKVTSLQHNNFLWTNVSLTRHLKKHSFDLFHSPGYTLPIWLQDPSAVSIHDVSYAAHPEWYPYRSDTIRKIWYRLSARSADCILAPSEFSKREIMRVYHILPEKVWVVSLGVDRRKFRKLIDGQLLDGLKKRYGLGSDFLLFVGDIHRRRNVMRIIEAFGAIKNHAFQKLELVLIGRILDSSISAGMIMGLPHGSSVHMTGYVPEKDLVLFYNAARAFLFPSFYEGFGLGVLEAMACGCPVIVSKGTACEEVAGDAAVLVDPTDTKSIVAAAIGILENRDLAEQHAEAGVRRSEEFSWRKTAERTILAYQHIAGR